MNNVYFTDDIFISRAYSLALDTNICILSWGKYHNNLLKTIISDLATGCEDLLGQVLQIYVLKCIIKEQGSIKFPQNMFSFEWYIPCLAR